VTTEPVWFGPEGRRLFGWLGHPANGASTVGVLLCPPIGAEALAAYRALRDLALRLNEAGLSTLRLDYDGTGDSAGDMNDAGRVSAWIESVAAGAALLRQAGATRICGVGMRLGANLLVAAAHRLPTQALVLWDPCASGAAFVREQVALSAQVAGASEGGAIDAPDLFYEAATAEDIRTGLPPLTVPDEQRRILMLARPDRPVRKELRAALSAPGVEWGPATGQHELIGVPVEAAELPEQAIREITGWLRRAVAAELAHRPIRELPAAVAASGAEVITASGRRLTERPLRLGAAGLFGIATEPERPRSDTVAVFINVANERRLGPDRGWVRLARHLAEHGIRSVRLDLSGVGDSPSRPGRDRDVVYAPEWLHDLPDAVRTLAPAPVVLVGLCSGAYSALECALSGQVRGVCAINPVLDIEWLAPPSPLWHPERRALRVMPGALRRLGLRHRRLAAWIWRALRQAFVRGDPAHVLAGAVRRGAHVLIVVSAADARAFRRTLFWRLIGLPWLRRSGRFRFEVVEALDHAADRAAGRNAAFALIAGHLIATCVPRELI
jgi:alpha-beta hydrolase superfamily lysophospholipase